MDLKQLEKNAPIWMKNQAGAGFRGKKARFSALIARLRPELLDFDEEAIKGLVTQSETQPQPTFSQPTGETI